MSSCVIGRITNSLIKPIIIKIILILRKYLNIIKGISLTYKDKKIPSTILGTNYKTLSIIIFLT